MKAKFVYESITDILVPKATEEIKANVEKEFPIKKGDIEEATKLLRAGIHRNSVEMIRYALDNGAKILDDLNNPESHGNLWVAFNEGSNNKSEELILELLKHSDIKHLFSDNGFRIALLEKMVYYGLLESLDWFLNSEHANQITKWDVANAQDNAYGSSWHDYEEARNKLADWAEENFDYSVSEAMGDILQPKSEEEFSDVLKNVSLEEYQDMVTDAIDDFMETHDLEGGFLGYDGVDDAYAKRIPPPTFARQAIENHFKEKWKPDGVMGLSNTGGIEMRFNDHGDGVEYRYTGEIIPKAAEIEYDYEYEGDRQEAYFEDSHGNKWELENFMRYES